MEHRPSIWGESPPKFATKPNRVVVREGQTGKFSCKITGRPQPQVTWFKVWFPPKLIFSSSWNFVTWKGEIQLPLQIIMVRIYIQGELFSSSFLCWINSQKIIVILLSINVSLICLIVESICTKPPSSSTKQDPSSIIKIVSVGRTCQKTLLTRQEKQTKIGKCECYHHLCFIEKVCRDLMLWLWLQRSLQQLQKFFHPCSKGID